MLDTIELVKTLGYVGLTSLIFTETGLLIGLLLPGDSVLFSAGFLASMEYLHLLPLFLLTFCAAVLGDSVGYALGKKYGPKIFVKEKSLFFDKQHIERAQRFYTKHGGKTVILARFIPIIRTLAPVLAGVGAMRYKTFLAYNIVGGFLWTTSVLGLGYFLGKTIPNADKYVLPIVAGIIFVSLIPPAISFIKQKTWR